MTTFACLQNTNNGSEICYFVICRNVQLALNIFNMKLGHRLQSCSIKRYKYIALTVCELEIDIWIEFLSIRRLSIQGIFKFLYAFDSKCFSLSLSPHPLLLLPITCGITFSHSILTLKLQHLLLVYRSGTSVYREYQREGDTFWG
jgi:hypothetical protein